MKCEDCHLGDAVKGLIDKYTCGLDHSDDRRVRNAWDGCDIVESVHAHERASRLRCEGCGCYSILIETVLPTTRTVVERPLEPPKQQARLIDSRLEKAGEPTRTFECEDCGHRWPVPDWFPVIWEAKPADVGHMTIEELASHLKDKIIGGLGVPRRYLGSQPREPVPEYDDDQLLTGKAFRDCLWSETLEARVINAMYENCAHMMPQENGEAEKPFFGPGSISTDQANDLAESLAHGHCSGSTRLLHDALGKRLKKDC